MLLEQATSEKRVELSERQARLLERFSPEFRERHIIIKHTGELMAVDTFYVGQLKGAGKVYLQTVIDCFSLYAWGRLYTPKLPITAVQVLNNDALPFFEKHSARITTILSDNGREFCGRPDTHPYELFLQPEKFEHSTTRVRRPESNDFVERIHRTLLDEHFRVKGREKRYKGVDEMQTDLDNYLKRPHQGRDMNGRTPYAVFMRDLPKEKKTVAKSVLKTA